VADVGLDGADVDRIALGAVLAKGRRHCAELAHIARLSARAMALDVGRALQAQPGALVHASDVSDLRLGAGQRDACGAAVLIDSRAPDDGSDRVVISHGIGKSLQDNNSYTLTSSIAIGSRIEGEASTIRAEKVQCRHGHDGIGSENQSSAPSQRLKMRSTTSVTVRDGKRWRNLKNLPYQSRRP
jgi:hypothetical protein